MDFEHLVALSHRYHPETEENICDLPGLSVFRREAQSDVEAFVYEPVICLILQGAKTTAIGNQVVELQPGDALVVSHDLPVVSRITRASARAPYLALIFTLDLGLVRSLFDEVGDALERKGEARALAAGRAEEGWLTPLARYFEMMDRPLDARVLGPGLRREIHYRLLLSPIGGMLRQFLVAQSHANRVAKAIAQVRAGFRAPIAIADLARVAGMSASSFHDHFKAVTGTTPLQYQKDLRLIEAKTLLCAQSASVSEAAYAVGYESPTHFSRDYRRKFGVPPSRAVQVGP